MASAEQKYRDRYAEPEIAALGDDLPEGRYRHVLVIPVYHEPDAFLTRLLAKVALQNPLLVILVINSPDWPAPSQSQRDAETRTQQLLTRLTTGLSVHWQQPGLSLGTFRNNHQSSPLADFLLVDRCTQGRKINPAEGVGLARKIGNDLACLLIANGIIRSNWIHNSDADVQLPADYFDIGDPANCPAQLYPFRHRCDDPALQPAMDLYELSLHYYTAGLTWAGSPYAYHTIGSTLAIHHRYYCQARGFPKRNGAEDFYLLNKLNKLAPVKVLDSPALLIAGRRSNRVPFGTGPAIVKISEYTNPAGETIFYHPQVFAELKNWIEAMPLLWQKRGQASLDTMEDWLTGLVPNGETNTLAQVLTGQGAVAAIKHAMAHSRNQQTFTRHMHTWFDGFRTLKFIHLLRDRGLTSKPLSDSVLQAPFIKGGPETDERPAGNRWQTDAITRLLTQIPATPPAPQSEDSPLSP